MNRTASDLISDSNITATRSYTEMYTEKYKEFKESGLSDVQSRARAKIGTEVYQGEPGHIVFNGYHFYYVDGTNKRYEGQTYANCSIYALIRLLKHLGQCGYIDADFWKQYSDEDLRIMIDNIGRGKGYYISQRVTVVPLTLYNLMHTLIPEEVVPNQYTQIYDPNGTILNLDVL
ncbi:MAG: hypothetical protein LBC22_00180 [Endomicrobium sp.]|nr:hypothetical protein [Endomicrobium sp.]